MNLNEFRQHKPRDVTNKLTCGSKNDDVLSLLFSAELTNSAPVANFG
jgi:hypothetical protein